MKGAVGRLTRFLRPARQTAKDPQRAILAHPPDRAKIDVFVVSYPKSGRTWLRFLIGKALVAQFQLDDWLIPETYHLTEMLPVPTIQFVHNGTDLHKADRFKYGSQEQDKNRFVGKKVLFMIRDPRDVMVSSYYWALKHARCYSGTISAFIRSNEYGIRKLIEFYNIWHDEQHVPDSFYLMSYEELHCDTYRALNRLFQYLDLVIDRTHLDQAIQYARFDNLRRMEESRRARFLVPGNRNDHDSYKTRQGQVGTYSRHLSPQDVAYIDDVIQEMGCPFLQDAYLTQFHTYIAPAPDECLERRTL